MEDLAASDGNLPASSVPSCTARVTLRDYVGLEDCDSQVIHAMVEFSSNVLVGNMDEAFKAIKQIKR